MPDEFYGDETLLISHETLSLSLLAILIKIIIFNIIKLSVKFPLSSPPKANDVAGSC